jgi:hypothetical protein
LAIGALALLVLTAGAAYIGVRGGGEPSQFTLPTTAGKDVTLNQHLGKHNVLLYFNEGMG